jgi:hypothetical protein
MVTAVNAACQKVFPRAILSTRAIGSSALPCDTSHISYENKNFNIKAQTVRNTRYLRKQIICL